VVAKPPYAFTLQSASIISLILLGKENHSPKIPVNYCLSNRRSYAFSRLSQSTGFPRMLLGQQASPGSQSQ
jgi:hypothetical protein